MSIVLIWFLVLYIDFSFLDLHAGVLKECWSGLLDQRTSL